MCIRDSCFSFCLHIHIQLFPLKVYVDGLVYETSNHLFKILTIFSIVILKVHHMWESLNWINPSWSEAYKCCFCLFLFRGHAGCCYIKLFCCKRGDCYDSGIHAPKGRLQIQTQALSLRNARNEKQADWDDSHHKESPCVSSQPNNAGNKRIKRLSVDQSLFLEQ